MACIEVDTSVTYIWLFRLIGNQQRLKW